MTSQLGWLLPALDITKVPPECLFSPASCESLILPNDPLPFIYGYTLTLFLKLGFDSVTNHTEEIMSTSCCSTDQNLIIKCNDFKDAGDISLYAVKMSLVSIMISPFIAKGTDGERAQ